MIPEAAEAVSTSLLLASIARLAASFLPRHKEHQLPPLPDDMLTFSGQLTAASRALETERAAHDRIISDPYAEALAGPAAMARARNRVAQQPSAGLLMRIPMRTRYFDDFASSALARLHSQPVQLISLAAGMDTRPYRLAGLTEAVSSFEVDLPQVLSYKQDVLQKLEPPPTSLAGSHMLVAADLSAPGWQTELASAGYNKNVPTVWLVEGLCYYLPSHRVQALLKEIADFSASESTVCLSAVTRLKENRSGLARMFLSAMPYPRKVMEEAGWQLDAVDSVGGPRVNHRRWLKEWEPPRTDENGEEDWSSAPYTIYVCGTKG